ncbi:MAG: type IV secretion system protein VirB7 [Alphaproteobacteria bacterium]|nr:type IV secretion system protein VirB7 [Rickettsiales bacterium]
MIGKIFGKICLLVTVALLSGCASSKVIDLKSPCVSNHGGPCARVPVNDWFLKSNGIVAS